MRASVFLQTFENICVSSRTNEQYLWKVFNTQNENEVELAILSRVDESVIARVQLIDIFETNHSLVQALPIHSKGSLQPRQDIMYVEHIHQIDKEMWKVVEEVLSKYFNGWVIAEKQLATIDVFLQVEQADYDYFIYENDAYIMYRKPIIVA